MSTIDTNVYVNKDELGKNLYRKKTYYTLCIEQECLAKNKDEADDKMSECGIDHSKIGKDITEEKDGVETYMVDANYTDSDKTDYIGKVVYDDYDSLENAVENGDVEISSMADETDVINEKGELVTEAENDCNSIQKSIDDLDKVEAKADKESVPF
jgi:hypothetical protein|tara:strand:+ start:363 stop:830 length:468 start_codon:yes stop_codon:yes gene_type:complete